MGRKPIIAVMHDWGSVAENFDHLGAIVLDVSLTSEVEPALKAADALVLTGGGDVDPNRYGAEPHKQVYGVDANRDRQEFMAVKIAKRRRLPMFGICRGHQLLNVAHGGSLIQHLGDNRHVGYHSSGSHPVHVRKNTLLSKAVGTFIEEETTTLHHQAVDRVGSGLLAAGWTEDGVVEVIESVPGRTPYVLGTQFHPELDWSKKYSDGIFELFYRKAVHRAQMSGATDVRLERLPNSLVWQNYRSHSYGTIWDSDKGYQSGKVRRLSSRGSEMRCDDDEYGDWLRLNAMELSRQTSLNCKWGECLDVADCAMAGFCQHAPTHG